MISADVSGKAAPGLSSFPPAVKVGRGLPGERVRPVGSESSERSRKDDVISRKDNVTILVAATAKTDAFGPADVAAAIVEGVHSTLPSARVLRVPDIDAGSCFVDQVVELSNGRVERISLLGLHGELVLGQLGLMDDDDGLVAVIAAEVAVELARDMLRPRDPTSASSRAIGQLIAAALDRGARRIIVACGDSGAYDGGIGMAGALGIRFLDPQRAEIVEAGGLLRLADIDMSHRDPRLAKVSIQAVVDPALALQGAGSVAHTHAPRHGASTSQVLRLERGLSRFARVVHERLGLDVAALPGAGAAGGLAAGLAAFAGAAVVSRSDFLDRLKTLQAVLASADMAITAAPVAEPALAGSPPAAGGEVGHACAWLERKAAALGLPVITLSPERLLAANRLEERRLAAAASTHDFNVRRPQPLHGDGGARLPATSAASLRRALGGWHRPAESA